MGFRHSHIGINLTSKKKKKIYIYIYIYTHTYWSNVYIGRVSFDIELNPIGIKISNQFVCFYLINPIKSGIHMNRKKKKIYGKKENFLL